MLGLGVGCALLGVLVDMGELDLEGSMDFRESAEKG